MALRCRWNQPGSGASAKAVRRPGVWWAGPTMSPTAVADTGATNEDTAVTLDVLGNDGDLDGDTPNLAGLVGSFDTTVQTLTTAFGATVSVVGGQIVYDPSGSALLQAMNNGDSTIDSFSYRIDDGHGGTATAMVSLNVTGIADGFLL